MLQGCGPIPAEAEEGHPRLGTPWGPHPGLCCPAATEALVGPTVEVPLSPQGARGPSRSSITLAPVAGAMASSCRIVQSPHPHSNHRITLPYQRPVEFLSALLCPLPLRDLGIIRCFLCIIPTCTRSSEGVIGPNCVGYLPSSLLLNHSHILVGMVTFNMDFSERKSGRLPQATPLEALNLPNLSEYLKTSP